MSASPAPGQYNNALFVSLAIFPRSLSSPFIFPLPVTLLQPPISMLTGRRLMAEGSWWTWKEDVLSKGGVLAG